MITRLTRTRLGLLILVLPIMLLYNQKALALHIPVGPNVFEKSTISSFDWSSSIGPNGGFQAGTVSDPVAITLDGAAAPWTKLLPGAPAASIGNSWTLVENMVINSNTPYTNWTEALLSKGWSWTNGTVYVNGQAATGLSTTITPTGTLINFDFNALPTGTQIQIVKTMQWGGLPDMTTWGNNVPITVTEWTTPVPEPATLGLISLGGGLLAFTRLRRRKSALAAQA